MRGTLGFPVTPFRQDLSLDLDSLASLDLTSARHPFQFKRAESGPS